MDRDNPVNALTPAQRIQVATEAAKAFREARRSGMPLKECIRLLDEWRGALRQIRDG